MDVVLKILCQILITLAVCCMVFSYCHGISIWRKAKAKETKAQILSFIPVFAMATAAIPSFLAILINSKIEPEAAERIATTFLEWYMLYIGPVIIIAGNIAALTFHNNLKKANISVIALSVAYLILTHIIA